MDMGSISAAVSSLKIAGEIAVGMMNLKTASEVQVKSFPCCKFSDGMRMTRLTPCVV